MRTTGFLLVILGAGVVVIWIASLLSGTFAGDLRTYQDGNYPTSYLMGELVMAVS